MIRITMFGPTAVEGRGHRWQSHELGGAKPRQLLQLLALELGRPVSKERLAERLWSGRPPGASITTLESYVCQLRRRLALAGGSRTAVTTAGSGYLLDPEQVSVDVADARRLLADGGVRNVALAMDLAAPGLLAHEPDAPWAEEEREHFTSALAAGCIAAAHRANLGRDAALAVRLARTAVRHSYACEPAVQELMRALWRLDARAEALDVYADLRSTMLEELGMEPGPATNRLYLAVLRSGSISHSRSADERELGALFRLLGQLLEASGIGRDPDARRFVEAGRRYLSVVA